MLAIFTGDRILSPRLVCQNCLLANHQGLPRWQQGKLGCGSRLNLSPYLSPSDAYQCPMGFYVAEVAETETVFLAH
jgi:hypothetical protein